MNNNLFTEFTRNLAGETVTNIWIGHGASIFLEYGQLHPVLRHDGSKGEAQGEFTLMIESNWRIENDTSIICGSWSEEDLWNDTFANLIQKK